jgi:nuclear cap-binding protein subunit 1
VRIRKQLLAIAENPMRSWHDEVLSIANLFTDNWDDELLRSNFVDLVLQLSVEQPLKTPFLAAVVLVANTNKPEIVDMLLAKLTSNVTAKIKQGDWRDVKLYLKLLACMQKCLEGEGIFPVLEDLFSRAVDLQTASSDDVCSTCLFYIGISRLGLKEAALTIESRQLEPSLLRSFCLHFLMSWLLPQTYGSKRQPT